MAKEKRARLNVQALARREPRLMSCIGADTDEIIVSLDLGAGEPTVSTHFSQDVNYRWATFDGVGKEPFYKDGVLMIDDIYLQCMSVSPMGKARMLAEFNRDWNGLSFAQQWLKDPEVIKKHLKPERQFHKMMCLGEDALIAVKGRGYLPIDKVPTNALVWDGDAWVQTDGPCFMGYKAVIDFQGTYVTDDHKILTRAGWQTAGSVDQSVYQKIAPGLPKPSFGWSDVWEMARSLCRSESVQKFPIYLCRRWGRAVLENIRQLKSR